MSGDGYGEQRTPDGRPDLLGGRDHRSGHGGSGKDDRVPDTAPDTAPQPSSDPEEQALRALLHSAVRDIEPAPDALDRLRRAVPARRARRRRILIGTVAAVLAAGTATPVLVRSGAVSHMLGDTAATAADSWQYGGDGEGSRDGDAGTAGSGGDAAHHGGHGHPVPARGAEAAPSHANDTLAPVSPGCLRTQLGNGGTTAGEPDGGNRVYGSFRITNISDASCRIEGPDTVSATTRGDADAADVSVVDHTAGDPATGLPDPETELETLILEPGQSYVVRFAWVPREGGGASGCRAPEPSPSPEGGTGGSDDPDADPDGSGPSESPDGPGSTDSTDGTGSGTDETDGGNTTGGDGTTGGDDGDGSRSGTITTLRPGTSTQLGRDGTGGDSPSSAVILRYVPTAGEPRIGKVVLEGACAGTVYRTGFLAP